MSLRGFFIAVLLFPTFLHAQMGIGTLAPDPAAQLEIEAADRGLLIPRIALKNRTDKSTISAGNVESLLLYNTTSNHDLEPGFYYWKGLQWHRLMDTEGTGSKAVNPVKVIKKDYIPLKTDRILLGKTTKTDITITLPDPKPYKGKKYTVRKKDRNESHYLIIKGNIGGLSSADQLYTALPYTGWDFVSDGVQWQIVNKF